MLIGPVLFDSRTGEVHRPGTGVVRLEPQPAAVLTRLAATPGELVSHAELRASIWGDGTHVNFQQSLHYCIRQIRLALDSGGQSPSAIQTIPRRGYRLCAKVATSTTAAAERPNDSRAARPLRWAVWAGLAAAAIAGVAVLEQRPNDHHRIAVAVLRALHDAVY